MLIADYEIFKHDSLLGVLDTETNEIYQMWSVDDIKEFIRNNLSEVWVGYNSENYDKKGISPDVEVELPDEFKNTSLFFLSHEDDTQLGRALEEIKK